MMKNGMPAASRTKTAACAGNMQPEFRRVRQSARPGHIFHGSGRNQVEAGPDEPPRRRMPELHRPQRGGLL